MWYTLTLSFVAYYLSDAVHLCVSSLFTFSWNLSSLYQLIYNNGCTSWPEQKPLPTLKRGYNSTIQWISPLIYFQHRYLATRGISIESWAQGLILSVSKLMAQYFHSHAPSLMSSSNINNSQIKIWPAAHQFYPTFLLLTSAMPNSLLPDQRLLEKIQLLVSCKIKLHMCIMYCFTYFNLIH